MSGFFRGLAKWLVNETGLHALSHIRVEMGSMPLLVRVNEFLGYALAGYLVTVFVFRIVTVEYIPPFEAFYLTSVTGLLSILACLDILELRLLSINFAPILTLMEVYWMYFIWRKQIRGPVPPDVDMAGKVVLITGSNSGIGVETARALARMKAHVIMACRTKKTAMKIQNEIIQSTGNKNVELMLVDLSEQESVNGFVKKLKSRNLPKLDVLINNAGVMLPKRCQVQNINGEPIEMMLQVNCLGPFVLNLHVLELLEKSDMNGGGRIVNVGSSMAQVACKMYDGFDFGDVHSKNFYEMFISYGKSKLALWYACAELNRRLRTKGSSITVNYLMPGTIHSNITRHLNPIIAGGQVMIQPINKTYKSGSYTTVYLATSPKVAGVSGKWFEHCAPVPALPERFHDEDIAQRVWQLCEALTGFDSSKFL